MRKFTYKDVSSWKVVDAEGKVLSSQDQDGKIETLDGFNGYRPALRAAKKFGGTPVRE